MNIERNSDEQRFVAEINKRKFVIDYEEIGKDTLELKRTFVPKDLRHNGIGHQLVEDVLSYARRNHYKIKPTCPFVRSMVEENQSKYADLII